MALTEQLMRSMPDDQLVRALNMEINSLTSTAAKIVLLERFEAFLGETDHSLQDVAAEYSLAAKDIKLLGDSLILNTERTVALLHVIGEAGIDTPEELKTLLQAHQQFCSIAEDAGDVFTRLSQLTTTVQED